VTDPKSSEFVLKQLHKKVENSLDLFEKVAHRYPNLVWEVGFSGGKDSTVVCHLLFEYLMRALTKRLLKPLSVYVLYSDTLLDAPILRRHALEILGQMQTFSREKLSGLVRVHILKPKENEDFLSLMLERGYPAPHRRFRWCMDRLKIEPTTRFLSQFRKYVMITGVRRDESAARSRNMIKRGQTRKISTIDNVIMFAPILDWKEGDVWTFLRVFKQPWNGHGYEKLEAIYRTSDKLQGCTGGCQLTPNNRFGCWVCTVVKRDRMLERLNSLDPRYSLLHNAKEEIRKISLSLQYREKKTDGTYGKLNEAGREAVAKIISKVYSAFPDAFEGYLEDPLLREKLFKWISSSDKAIIKTCSSEPRSF